MAQKIKKVRAKLAKASKKARKEIKEAVKKTERIVEKPVKKTLEEGDCFFQENIERLTEGIEKVAKKDAQLKRRKVLKKDSVASKASDLLKTIQKDLNVVSYNTSNLLKKARSYFVGEAKKSEKELEIMSLVLKREKLYYLLGKEIGSFPKRKGHVNRKLSILNKIKIINRKIRKIKK